MDNITQEKPDIMESDSKIEGEKSTSVDALLGGKFRDTEDLVKAYNMLQADYTKKCQMLSQLQKKTDGESSSKLELDAINSWNKKVEDFFEKVPKAREYATQLADIIKTDSEISKSADPMDSAWTKFAKENFVDKTAIASDEEFLKKYIFSNEEIKNKILADYFSSLNKSASPSLINKSTGASVLLTPKQKPKTIRDATSLVEDMFEV